MTRLCLVLAGLAAIGLIAAGCGDDDEADNGDDVPVFTAPGAEEAASLQEEIADLSDEEQIARVGEAWAEPFGNEDEAMCGYLHPDIAGGCSQYIQGALTGSSELQVSFAGTTVENVEIQGDTAVATFSNENQVLFNKDPDGAWKVVDTARVESSGSDKVIQPG